MPLLVASLLGRAATLPGFPMPATAGPDLIARIQAGDRVAQLDWFTRHLDQLTRWTDLRVGVSPGHGGGASDVVQNVALDLTREVFQGLPTTIRTEEHLLREVRMRLCRRAIDLARKQVLHGLTSTSTGGATTSGPDPARLTTPSLQAVRDELEEYLVGRIAEDPTVPPDALGTAAVLLRQIDEVPLKVIASDLAVGCVELAQRYYDVLRPLRDGIDKRTVGTWPMEWDTDREKVLRALTELTSEQREAVELCNLERDAYRVFDASSGSYRRVDGRYSLVEAGQVFGIDPGAVGARTYRGVRALKAALSSRQAVPAGRST